jgi:hypothetical protein
MRADKQSDGDHIDAMSVSRLHICAEGSTSDLLVEVWLRSDGQDLSQADPKERHSSLLRRASPSVALHPPHRPKSSLLTSRTAS